jgi:hypothetical protein
MNLNDHTVTWDTDTILMKNRDTCTLLPVEGLIEVYMSSNEPQTLRDEYFRLPKFLMLGIILQLQAWMMSSRHVRTFI